MPTRITIACTHCGTKLNLTDESKLGKKFKCPKCAEVFVAAAADDEEVLDIDDAQDDDEDEEEEQPRLKRSAGGGKSQPARGGKGKTKPAKSGGNTGLIFGGIAGGAVLLFGLVGVLFATGVFGGGKPDPNQIQVSSQTGPGMIAGLLKEQGPTLIPARTALPDGAQWLSADTEFVVHVRPADILSAPVVAELLKSMGLDQQLNAATAEWGVQISDIESITFGIAQMEKAQQTMQHAQMAMMMGKPQQPLVLDIPAIGIIKFKKSISYDDLTKLSNQIAKDQTVSKAQHAGKDYLETTNPYTPTKGAVWLATNSVVVLGDSANLKAVMEKGAAAKPLKNFGFADWTDSLTIAFAPQKPESLQQQMKTGMQANPMAGMAMGPIAEGAIGFSFGLTVKEGVEAEIAVGCADPKKMEAIAKSLNDLSTMGRGQYDQSKSQLPPWAVSLTDLLVNNLQVSSSNRVVLVNTNIPDSAKDQLVQLPGTIMASMALGGLMGAPPAAEMAASPGDASEISPGENSTTVDSVPVDQPDTEPTNVAAKSVEKLPKGFELNGSLSDGYQTAEAGKRPLNFSLELSLVGDEECRIVAVGKLQEGEGTLAGGDKVPLAVQSSYAAVEGEAGWELLFNTTPDTGLVSSIVGTYEFAVGDDSEPLESIRGSFRYLTGKKSKLIQIKNAKSLAGKESENAALKAAGLTIETGTMNDSFGEIEILTVSVEKGFLLSKLQPLDAKGKLSYATFGGLSPNEQIQILKPGVGSQQLEDGVGFQAYVYSDLEEVEVPFTFENVALPKPTEK